MPIRMQNLFGEELMTLFMTITMALAAALLCFVSQVASPVFRKAHLPRARHCRRATR